MLNLIWMVPLFPLIGAVANGFFGFRMGKEKVTYWALGTTGLSFLVAVLAFIDLLGMPSDHRVFEQVIYTWIGSGTFTADAGFLVDPLSGLYMLFVTGVGFVIHVYSVGYMGHEKAYPRFFCYLNLFMFSMLMLVLGNNFLIMFIGWEGVGLCSYLLIGYYYQKKSASDAGKKAFIMNRIGDFGFILAILYIWTVFGDVGYLNVFGSAGERLAVGGSAVTTITLLLFLGATGKSAQIPLYTWLPDAMEGPTPVSALIHAATMVTAGIYMVARCHVLFNLAPATMAVVAAVGAVTAVFAACIGLYQMDIKRVLAYSTVSQLGYMFLACGIGAYTAGVFHVVTHAFFKACLFLGSGSVIHTLNGEQDMRKMGALRTHMPKTYWTFLISTLAIAGIFPFAGFFSKDEILWNAASGGHYILWGIAFFAAGMTAFYMFRLVFMTFHGKSRVEEEARHHLHESPSVMTLPLVVLAFGATVGGFLGIPLLEGYNVIHNFLGPVFATHLETAVEAAEEAGHAEAFTEMKFMALSMGIAGVGIALAYYFYIVRPERAEQMSRRYGVVYRVIQNKFYVDELYEAAVTNPIVEVSRDFLWRFFDVRVIDGLVNDTASLVRGFAGFLRGFQTGYVYHYATGMVLGLIFIVSYFLLI